MEKNNSKSIEDKLKIAINALEAIIHRPLDYNSCEALMDCQKCASNALKMINDNCNSGTL